MRFGALFFRRVHKWIGLILGIQFVLWAVSGAMMATLGHHEVAGGDEARAARPSQLPNTSTAWPSVQQALGEVPVRAVSVAPLLSRYVFNIDTKDGIRIFDAETGAPVRIDASLAGKVALAAHPTRAAIKNVAPLTRVTLAVRDHALPIWRIDFADEANSSFYVSGTTGILLERRNDSWHLWDFFWMLHTMDYAKRASFNHPLIVVAAIGAVWLALTGLYLIFKTNWRPETRWVGRRRHPTPASR